MTLEDTIRSKLTAALAPRNVDVINESHLHHGHQGSPGTGESHFRVHIVSDHFAGKSRIERHRMVNDILKAELAGKIHALAVKATVPGEG